MSLGKIRRSHGILSDAPPKNGREREGMQKDHRGSRGERSFTQQVIHKRKAEAFQSPAEDHEEKMRMNDWSTREMVFDGSRGQGGVHGRIEQTDHHRLGSATVARGKTKLPEVIGATVVVQSQRTSEAIATADFDLRHCGQQKAKSISLRSMESTHDPNRTAARALHSDQHSMCPTDDTEPLNRKSLAFGRSPQPQSAATINGPQKGSQAYAASLSEISELQVAPEHQEVWKDISASSLYRNQNYFERTPAPNFADPLYLFVLYIDSITFCESSLEGRQFSFQLSWVVDSHSVTTSLLQYSSSTSLDQWIRIDWFSYLESSLAEDTETNSQNGSATQYPELYLRLKYNNTEEDLAVGCLRLGQFQASEIFRKIHLDLFATSGVFARAIVFIAAQPRWVFIGSELFERQIDQRAPPVAHWLDVDRDDQSRYLEQYVASELRRRNEEPSARTQEGEESRYFTGINGGRQHNHLNDYSNQPFLSLVNNDYPNQRCPPLPPISESMEEDLNDSTFSIASDRQQLVVDKHRWRDGRISDRSDVDLDLGISKGLKASVDSTSQKRMVGTDQTDQTLSPGVRNMTPAVQGYQGPDTESSWVNQHEYVGKQEGDDKDAQDIENEDDDEAAVSMSPITRVRNVIESGKSTTAHCQQGKPATATDGKERMKENEYRRDSGGCTRNPSQKLGLPDLVFRSSDDDFKKHYSHNSDASSEHCEGIQVSSHRESKLSAHSEWSTHSEQPVESTKMDPTALDHLHIETHDPRDASAHECVEQLETSRSRLLRQKQSRILINQAKHQPSASLLNSLLDVCDALHPIRYRASSTGSSRCTSLSKWSHCNDDASSTQRPNDASTQHHDKMSDTDPIITPAQGNVPGGQQEPVCTAADEMMLLQQALSFSIILCHRLSFKEENQAEAEDYITVLQNLLLEVTSRHRSRRRRSDTKQQKHLRSDTKTCLEKQNLVFTNDTDDERNSARDDLFSLGHLPYIAPAALCRLRSGEAQAEQRIVQPMVKDKSNDGEARSNHTISLERVSFRKPVDKTRASSMQQAIGVRELDDRGRSQQAPMRKFNDGVQTTEREARKFHPGGEKTAEVKPKLSISRNGRWDKRGFNKKQRDVDSALQYSRESSTKQDEASSSQRNDVATIEQNSNSELSNHSSCRKRVNKIGDDADSDEYLQFKQRDSVNDNVPDDTQAWSPKQLTLKKSGLRDVTPTTILGGLSIEGLKYYTNDLVLSNQDEPCPLQRQPVLQRTSPQCLVSHSVSSSSSVSTVSLPVEPLHDPQPATLPATCPSPIRGFQASIPSFHIMPSLRLYRDKIGHPVDSAHLDDYPSSRLMLVPCPGDPSTSACSNQSLTTPAFLPNANLPLLLPRRHKSSVEADEGNRPPLIPKLSSTKRGKQRKNKLLNHQ